MKNQNPYQKLTLNTVLLSFGTLGSKLISIVMLRFYTGILTPSEYGIIDLLSQTANLMMPFCMLGIAAGIVRFGLDEKYRNSAVFTTALLCVNLGFVACLLVAPLLSLINDVGDYLFLLYLYLLMASLRVVCASFVRAEERVLLYAVSGVFNTLCNVLLMILLLKGFRLSIAGYLLAVILADFFSILFLVLKARLWEQINFKIFPHTAKPMILYSLPMIPTTVNWLIMNTADRFMIRYFHGNEANGLFAVAAKVPLVITILAGVFIDAWHISIIGTKTQREQARFFGKILHAYQALLFVAASGVIVGCRLLMQLMTTAEAFQTSWKYVPLLLCATVFSCLATFIGTIYTVTKNSKALMVTTLISGGLNLVLNLMLIPWAGANGAAMATLLSFMTIFVIRMIHTRRLLLVPWRPVPFLISFGLILIQSMLLILEVKPVYLFQMVLFFFILLVNLRQMLVVAQKIRKRKATS